MLDMIAKADIILLAVTLKKRKFFSYYLRSLVKTGFINTYPTNLTATLIKEQILKFKYSVYIKPFAVPVLPESILKTIAICSYVSVPAIADCNVRGILHVHLWQCTWSVTSSQHRSCGLVFHVSTWRFHLRVKLICSLV